MDVSASTIPPPTAAEADAAAGAEYAAFVADVRGVPEHATDVDTDCAGWTVHDVVAHVTEAAREGAHPLVLALRYGRAALQRDGRELVDRVNDMQVRRARSLTWPDLLDELERLVPLAVTGRRRTPGVLRGRALPASQGFTPGDTIGFVNDVIYTRDAWMHRVDISRAVGLPMSHSTGEDVVVTQVVRDLGRTWTGPSLRLELSGRVTGNWTLGDPGPRLPAVRADAVDLCRRLSGREGDGHLEGPDVAVRALERARILF